VPKGMSQQMNAFLVRAARAGCLDINAIATHITKIPKLLDKLLEYLFGDELLQHHLSQNFSMRMIHSPLLEWLEPYYTHTIFRVHLIRVKIYLLEFE
jgi:hypothetical protein